MSIAARVHQLRKALRVFRKADGGNVVVPFALALLPIMGLIGAAVDYSRASSAKAAMQGAADATALMLMKELGKGSATLTPEQIGTKAIGYFNAQLNRPEVTDLQVAPVYTTAGGPQIVLTATANVPTPIMGVMGFGRLDIVASSTVKWGNTRLRVALVLDNTGSMSSASKMTALKSATTDLLTQLQAAAAQNGDVYVSIIPFAKDVNADPVNHSQEWIGWTEWEDEPDLVKASKPSNWSSIGPGSDCPFTNSNHGFRCTTGPVNGSAITSTIPSSGSFKGYICPSIDSGNKTSTKRDIYYNGCYGSVATTQPKVVGSGSNASCSGYSNCSCTGSGSNKVCSQTQYDHPWLKNAHNTWTGCVMDRDQSFDTTNTPAAAGTPATLFPAEQYSTYCPTPMMALSYDWPALKSKVNAMTPEGGTNQAVGLQLGFQSLTSAPFTIPPMDPKYQYQQVIILLTDGLNTQDRWYGNGSQHSEQVDDRQKILCNNIKSAGITIYAVQVNTTGDPTSTLLQGCASLPTTASPSDKFFLLTSATGIVETFNAIATDLSKLRVAK